VTRSLKKNPFVANHLLRKINKLNTKAEKEIIVTFMGERRELNPRMVDSQSTALIHLATSAPILFTKKLERFVFLYHFF
jgi:ribosomal protein S19